MPDSPTPQINRDICSACREPWITHSRLVETCDRLQVAVQALKQIASSDEKQIPKRIARNTLRLMGLSIR